MEFVIGVGGVLLFFLIYSYFIVRQEKREKQHAGE